jgi:hypothetical protein
MGESHSPKLKKRLCSCPNTKNGQKPRPLRIFRRNISVLTYRCNFSGCQNAPPTPRVMYIMIKNNKLEWCFDKLEVHFGVPKFCAYQSGVVVVIYILWKSCMPRSLLCRRLSVMGSWFSWYNLTRPTWCLRQSRMNYLRAICYIVAWKKEVIRT